VAAFHDEELIEVGGYRLMLAIDFGVLDHAEVLTGWDMPEIMEALASARPPVGVTGKLLFALLRRHHGQMTLDETAGLMLNRGAVRAALIEGMFVLLKRALNLGEKKDEGSTAKWSIETFLIEWVALGGSPAEFWRQTPRSYVTCMEGMVRAATRQTDMAIVTAWHTAIFALTGWSGGLKGKSLSDYLTISPRHDETRTKHAQGIAFFHSLKARGVPVEITRH
jgi:hypothetical protein